MSELPTYLLDTSICIEAMRLNPRVLARMHRVGQERLIVSTPVYAELCWGIEASSPVRKDANRMHLREFVDSVNLEPWCAAAAEMFGRHKHSLRRAGNLIGEMDLMIGCQALARDWIVATHNARDFARIQGLRLEEWAAP